MRKRRTNQFGMVTTEAMVGMLLIGLALAAISSFTLYSTKAQVGIEQSAQAYQLVNDARAILSSSALCTAMFKGKDPTAFNDLSASTPTDFPISGKDLDAPPPNDHAYDVHAGQQYQGIMVNVAGVRLRRQIASNLYMMYYEITVSRTNASGDQTGLGSKTLTTRIPFSMVTGSINDPVNLPAATAYYGKVVSCFTDPFAAGSSLIEETACLTSSQGLMIFDPSTQQCVADYDSHDVPGGNPYNATCNGTGKILGCYVAGALNQGGNSTTQQFLHASTPSIIKSPGSGGFVSGNSCTCDYTANYGTPSNGEICTAQCGVLRTTLVNAWPSQPNLH